MLTASSPWESASAMAASSTRSRLSGSRVPGRFWLAATFADYTVALRCKQSRRASRVGRCGRLDGEQRRNMGTWGPGIFENDETMDFLGDVEESGVEALRDAFTHVIASAGRAEAWAESTAVAAAAIVAAAYDDRADLLPEEAVATLPDLRPAIVEDPALRDAARRAVHLVLTGDSELLELWRASGESDAAIEAIADVQRRLSE